MTSSGAQGLLTLPVAPLNRAYDIKPCKAGNKAVSTPSTRRVSAKQKEICGLFQSIVSFFLFFFFCLKWNLICDRAFLGATIQSCYFAGMLIGSIVTGMISDAWGRKKCIFICNAIMVS